MNQEQFLNTLRRLLRKLPLEELEQVVEYYREMIADKIESGQPEEEAVRGLGNVYELARRILAENPRRRPKNTAKVALIALASVLGVCVIAAGAVGWGIRRGALPDRTKSIPAPGAAGNYTYKTQTAGADGVRSVCIDAENKAVIVKPWDSRQIQVKYATNDDQRYEFGTADGTFSVRNTENGGMKFGWNWNDSGGKPSITVMLPKDYSGDLRIVTENSDIRASDFQKLGDLRCVTANSTITVDGVSAKDLTFRTQNAAINLKNVAASGKISADTQNAQIGFDGIAAPDISLETQNALITGTIRGKEDDYTVEAETTNAISNLQSSSGGAERLTVKTTNAIISVRFEDS